MIKHLSQMHPRNDAPDLYVDGTTCQICMKNFHSWQRLTQHLKATSFCWTAWCGAVDFVPLPEERLKELREEKLRINQDNIRQGLGPRHA